MQSRDPSAASARCPMPAPRSSTSPVAGRCSPSLDLSTMSAARQRIAASNSRECSTRCAKAPRGGRAGASMSGGMAAPAVGGDEMLQRPFVARHVVNAFSVFATWSSGSSAV